MPKETRKQKIARQAKERDRLAGKRADLAFDPIRQAIDSGQLVIGPATKIHVVRTICRCDEDGRPTGEHSPDCPYKAALYAEAMASLYPPVKDEDAIPDTERPGKRW